MDNARIAKFIYKNKKLYEVLYNKEGLYKMTRLKISHHTDAFLNVVNQHKQQSIRTTSQQSIPNHVAVSHHTKMHKIHGTQKGGGYRHTNHTCKRKPTRALQKHIAAIEYQLHRQLQQLYLHNDQHIR